MDVGKINLFIYAIRGGPGHLQVHSRSPIPSTYGWEQEWVRKWGSGVDLMRPNTRVTLYHPPPSRWIRSFLKSKVQPPPPEGSVGLSEKSKVQPPPVGGSVGRSEKSKVQPPPPPPPPKVRLYSRVAHCEIRKVDVYCIDLSRLSLESK